MISVIHILAYQNSWQTILVFVGIMAFSAIQNWMRQRAARAESQLPRPTPEHPAPTPPPVGRVERHEDQPTPAPTPAFDWERELRRMMGEEEVPKPQPPPPIVAHPVAKPPPVPLAKAERPVAAPKHLAHLDQSAHAYQQASTLDLHTEQQLHQADATVTEHKPEGPRLLRVESPFRTELMQALRQRRSVTQAFVLSEVFGPPKALADSRNPNFPV